MRRWTPKLERRSLDRPAAEFVLAPDLLEQLHFGSPFHRVPSLASITLRARIPLCSAPLRGGKSDYRSEPIQSIKPRPHSVDTPLGVAQGVSLILGKFQTRRSGNAGCPSPAATLATLRPMR